VNKRGESPVVNLCGLGIGLFMAGFGMFMPVTTTSANVLSWAITALGVLCSVYSIVGLTRRKPL
jgi:hypothetical protein